jgi:hypothetical protein
VNTVPNILDLILINLQIQSDWEPIHRGCVVLSSESNKVNIIVLVITDIVLLLTLLIGLLHWRGDGSSTFGIGRLLWKQVRWQPFPSSMIPSAL